MLRVHLQFLLLLLPLSLLLQRNSCGRQDYLDQRDHHGNGTQEIFYSDPSIFYVSIHADPETVLDSEKKKTSVSL
jgi:acetoin utilization deacetylase AcuC-like enzyme